MLYKRNDLKNISGSIDKHKKQSSGGILSKDVLKILAKFTEKRLCCSLFFNKVADWIPEAVKSSHRRSSVKKMFLKSSTSVSEPAVHRSSTQNRCIWMIHKIHRKSLCGSLFLIKLQFWGPATLLKKTPTQVPSCEICSLFKNNYFEEHQWTCASKLYLKEDSSADVFL